MIRRRAGLLTAAAVLALSGPAAARCSEPYAPVVKAKATKEEMEALGGDVKAFLEASDVYQACLVKGKTDTGLIDASQAEKLRVGKEWNAALRSYKASHPG